MLADNAIVSVRTVARRKKLKCVLNVYLLYLLMCVKDLGNVYKEEYALFFVPSHLNTLNLI